jgi:DNA ligase (NAD+)
LGIRLVGNHIADVLAHHYISIDDIMFNNREELREIPDIGSRIADSIVSFFENASNIDMISKLGRFGIKMTVKMENI